MCATRLRLGGREGVGVGHLLVNSTPSLPSFTPAPPLGIALQTGRHCYRSFAAGGHPPGCGPAGSSPPSSLS